MYYWALMLLSFVAYGIGYLLSMVFRQTLAYIAGVVLVLSSTQFGGVSPLLRTLLNSPFYPTRAMPYMSVVRWATELIYLVEIQEYHNMKIYNIDRALEFYMFSFDNMWKTSVILVSWGIATRILAFILLQQSKPNSISNLIVYFVRAKWYKLTKWIETGLYNYKLRIVEKMKMQSVVDVDDHIHIDEEDN